MRDQHAIYVIDVVYSAAKAGLFEFRSPVAGEIREVRVFSDLAAAASDALFDVNIAGVSIWAADQSQRVKIASGATSGSKTGLSAAVAKDQKVTFDYDGGGTQIGGKLTVIIAIAETGAEATDAELRDRATHTGQQAAATISDFSEAVDDRVGALVTMSFPLEKLYDDGSNSLLFFINKYRARKIEVAGVAPDADADTYGPASEHNPSGDFSALSVPTYVALTSGGVFAGGETITVKLTLWYDAGAELTLEKTFNASGQETVLTAAEIFGLIRDDDAIIEIDVTVKSSIAGSAATGGAKVLCMNC